MAFLLQDPCRVNHNEADGMFNAYLVDDQVSKT